MKLVFLGTGTPIPSPERAGTGAAIVSDKEVLMIDCGPGSAFRFTQARLAYRKLSHLFLTHHHFDHTVSYGYVALESWITGRKRPLQVFGPQGTVRMSRLLFDEVYAEEIRSRISLGGQGPLGMEAPAEADSGMALLGVAPQDIDEGFSLQTDDWRMRAIRVDHNCPPYTLGYRLDWGEKAIVFSADTIPCPNLVEMAREVDVLVHEVFWPKAEGAWKSLLSQASAQEWARRWGHTTPEEVGKLAREARVKTLVLTHLTPYEDEAALTDMVRRNYSGELVVAQDLMEIEWK
ncbi:MAG: MBL fold metallo-hydrolase [Chloroflexi bacterium]|nr:MBL fold metallo-hydrolase [Chloroflexota bacterium]